LAIRRHRQEALGRAVVLDAEPQILGGFLELRRFAESLKDLGVVEQAEDFGRNLELGAEGMPKTIARMVDLRPDLYSGFFVAFGRGKRNQIGQLTRRVLDVQLEPPNGSWVSLLLFYHTLLNLSIGVGNPPFKSRALFSDGAAPGDTNCPLH